MANQQESRLPGDRRISRRDLLRVGGIASFLAFLESIFHGAAVAAPQAGGQPTAAEAPAPLSNTEASPLKELEVLHEQPTRHLMILGKGDNAQGDINTILQEWYDKLFSKLPPSKTVDLL